MPKSSTTLCRYAGCLFMESPYKMITKASYSFINFLAGITLAILIKSNFKENTIQTRRLNKTMLYILMTTTIIELIPFIGGQVFNTITGTQLIQYIGPYGNTLFMTNISILSTIYYKALSRTFNNNKIQNAFLISSHQKVLNISK
uniref:Uncharacterized protein n=1 Tax=Panagrolaimus davidi TaxID=227884 RepID=A0A914PRT6_9BILA